MFSRLFALNPVISPSTLPQGFKRSVRERFAERFAGESKVGVETLTRCSENMSKEALGLSLVGRDSS